MASLNPESLILNPGSWAWRRESRGAKCRLI